jgi:hypothetical protein
MKYYRELEIEEDSNTLVETKEPEIIIDVDQKEVQA